MEATAQFVTQAPALVVVLSAPVRGHQIPLWEQELSAGAACMNLLHAAHAYGFVGGWLTGWAAYSDDGARSVRRSAASGSRGSSSSARPARELEERPRGRTVRNRARVAIRGMDPTR